MENYFVELIIFNFTNIMETLCYMMNERSLKFPLIFPSQTSNKSITQ